VAVGRVVSEPGLNPFRVSKYFQEHVTQVLQSLDADPEGMYQIAYRVGDVMVAAQVWREPAQIEVSPEYTEADREFLRQIQVRVEEDPSGAVI